MKLFNAFLTAAVTCSAPAFALTPDSNGLYRISNAAELEEFAAIVNGGNTTANAVLTDNIDMNGVTHTAIGNTENPYRGEFDGRFHKIDNLEMEFEEGELFAIFGVAAVGAKFSNLIIGDGCIFSGKDKIAGLVGQCRDAIEGTIEFTCIGNEGAVYAFPINEEGGRAAAIAGPSNGNVAYKFVNCYNLGEIRGTTVGALSCYAPKAQVIGCFTVTDVKTQKSPTNKAGNPSPVSQMVISGVEEPLGPWTFNCFFGGSEGKGTYAENAYDKTSTWKPPYTLRENDWTIYKVYQDEWAPTGLLCWYLNNQSDENPAWGQDLDSGDVFPTFMPGTPVVYKDGETYVNKTEVLPGLAELPEQGSGVADLTISEEKDDIIYNLQGIKVKKVEVPGIYIINGKKVTVK